MPLLEVYVYALVSPHKRETFGQVVVAQLVEQSNPRFAVQIPSLANLFTTNCLKDGNK